MSKGTKKPRRLGKKGLKTRRPDPVPAIREKDQKILWSRSAGRCGICKAELTLDKLGGGAATLGAMCHIVGESKIAARGDSPLLIDERNSYPNLVLLCAHHHDIIDKNPKKYPVEVLHGIKAHHELWVNESLSAKTLDPDDAVYADWIDTITTALQLDRWEWFIDHAVRELVHEDFFNAQVVLNAKKLAAVFPKKHGKMNRAIQRLAASYSEMIEHYSSGCEDRGRGFHGPDHSYERFWNPHFQEHAEKEAVWADMHWWKLLEYVLCLNDYVREVRRYINPMYFRTRGTFIVYDSMGYRFGLKSTLYRPTRRSVDVVKKAAEKRREVFEAKKKAGAFPITAARTLSDV